MWPARTRPSRPLRGRTRVVHGGRLGPHVGAAPDDLLDQHRVGHHHHAQAGQPEPEQAAVLLRVGLEEAAVAVGAVDLRRPRGGMGRRAGADAWEGGCVGAAGAPAGGRCRPGSGYLARFTATMQPEWRLQAPQTCCKWPRSQLEAGGPGMALQSSRFVVSQSSESARASRAAAAGSWAGEARAWSPGEGSVPFIAPVAPSSGLHVSRKTTTSALELQPDGRLIRRPAGSTSLAAAARRLPHVWRQDPRPLIASVYV